MSKLFNEMSLEEQQEHTTQIRKHASLERIIQSKINEVLYKELNHIIDDPEVGCIEMAKNDKSLRVTIWFDRDTCLLKPYKTNDKHIWNYVVNTRCLKDPKTVSFEPPCVENDRIYTELVLSDEVKRLLDEIYSSKEYKEYNELGEKIYK